MSWEEVQLKDIASLKYGKLPPKESEDGEFPIFTGYRISGYAKERLYTEPQVIVVARGVGGTGDVKISPPNCWITNLSIVLDVNEKKVNKYFLYRRLGIEKLKDKLNTGAAQAQITIESLQSYAISLPPLPAQNRIASILAAYDDLIEVNNRRIRLLEDAARQLYQEWFVRLRFPGHQQTPVHDGLPEGWERVKVGTLLTLQRGFDLPKQDRTDGEYPIVAATGINGCHSEARVLGPGVVTGRSGSLGTVLYIHEDFWPLNTTLWTKEFKRVTPIYVHHLLSDLKLERFNGGAAVPTLNRNDVHDLDVIFSGEELVKQFTELLQPTYDQIKTLTLQNQKLRQARDLLLPRLMRGELLS